MQKAMRRGHALLGAFILMLAPHIARAQDPIPAAARDSGNAETARNSLTIVGAATFANGSIRGDAFDRHLTLTGIRYGRVLVSNDTLTLNYTPELIPAAWLSQPILGEHHEAVQRSIPPFTHTETTFAVGTNPIGFELMLRPQRKWQPIVGTDQGFLYFSRNVPSIGAARFNFTVDVRLGVRVRLDHGQALSFEYSYHHLSNGYRAAENAGLDSQMLCFGYLKVLTGS
jgi:Lipid A 3-O-deacylase (PagL)